jgi:hypothetical protein
MHLVPTYAFRGHIAKYAVPIYFALAFAISWTGILLVIGGPAGVTGSTAHSDPRFPLVYLAMLAGPAVSGVLCRLLVDGRAGLRDLGLRLQYPGLGIRGYAFALLTAPILILTAVLMLSVTSPRFLPGLFATDDTIALLFFAVVVGLGAGIFEELGWTGFAVPRLRRDHGMLATGLIVGAAWAAWHLLAEVWGIGGLAGPIPLAVFVPADLLSILPAYRVLMVWYYDRTQSLAGSMLMHASLTATLLTLSPAAATGAHLLAFDLLTAVALWGVAALLVVRRRSRAARLPRRHSISPAPRSAR